MSKKCLIILSCFALIIVLVFVQYVSIVQSQPPVPEHPKRGFENETGFERVLPAPVLQPAKTIQSPNVQRISWSKVVFETYIPANNTYEIFSANDDGSSLLRLTNHTANDIQPRMNRGGTRIAFASKRPGNYDIYAMNPDGSGLAQLTNNSKDDTNPAWSPDGTKIAFQSYRDGQSEIYVMNTNGSSQVRLTNDSGYDGEPAWSPDGTKIAWCAYRNGEYRIWVMSANGSGAEQLSNQAYSENPAWSPDGTKIAYDADGSGDGWTEVWLMNADGSNQHVVYAPPTANQDVYVRSWSPDGTWIAYTHVYYIYQDPYWYWTDAYLKIVSPMATPPVETALLGSNLDWLPDWQTLDAIIPTSSMQALPVTSPGPFTVSWSGSDGGGSGFKNFDIQVRDGAGGVWTDWMPATTATSESYPGIGGHTYYFRSRARDNAYNLENWPANYEAMTTVETLPPTTRMDHLPDYSFMTSQGIILSWTGNDSGGSGIRNYDVQYKNLPSGDWTDWQMGVSGPPVYFHGDGGISVAFRVRATDKASNQEAWHSPTGDTSTTTYNFGISGKTVDHTGVPVTGVTTSVDVQPMVNQASQRDGNFLTLINTGGQTVTSNWQKSGYGTLADTLFNVPANITIDPVLPPIDNVIGDPGLESYTDPNWYWETGGDPGPLASNIFHTGLSSILLGGPLSIGGTKFTDHASYFDTLVAPDGAVNVIYNAATDPTSLYALRKENNGVWSSSLNISGNPCGEWKANITTDGIVHVVFFQNNSLMHTFMTPSSGWSPPQPFYSFTSTLHTYLDIVSDANGNLHVIWQDQAVLHYVYRSPSGVWSMDMSPLTLTNVLLGGSIKVDGTGMLHWVYYMGSTLYYQNKSKTGNWSTPQLLTPQPVQVADPKLDLEVDDVGYAYLVWDQSINSIVDIFYSKRELNGVWSPPVNVSHSPNNSENPKIAVAGDGSKHVVWTENDSGTTGGVYYAVQSINGTWSVPENISHSPATSLYLTLDSHGNPHVLWGVRIDWDNVQTYYARKLGNWIFSIGPGTMVGIDVKIYFDSDDLIHFQWNSWADLLEGTTRRALVNGDSFISQQVTLPPQMTTPVLSFIYQTPLVSDLSGQYFAVEVQEGTNITRFLSVTTTTSSWTHRWFDLTPWIGKEITIRFFVHLVEGKEIGYALVDDVTIGSANADLWVGAESVATLPGATIEQTLIYGNQGIVPVEDVTVTATLPDKLTFVSADPAPTTINGQTLSWDIGDLAGSSGPFTIHVTADVEEDAVLLSTLDGSLQITTSSNELETANNTVQTHIWIGAKVFLPAITR